MEHIDKNDYKYILMKDAEWCNHLGFNDIDGLNSILRRGQGVQLVNLCEERHSNLFSKIANRIKEANSVKMVLLAGPSSSGKTSASLRLAMQCKVHGLNPRTIELDNYFVNREDTPFDENGERDYECLEAMDVAYLNRQLNDLLNGKEIEVPKFDFKLGERVPSGRTMTLADNEILCMEGIHALNPALTPAVDQSKIFRVYISALTAIPGGEKTHYSTTDKRLLRRIVRDNRTRGISPEDTLLRWASVRRGEENYIFPYEDNADIVFNSSTLYDVPLLKYYAEPLLYGISESSQAYGKATSLLDFLSRVVTLKPNEIAAIPPTSIMREFIGGQTL